MVEARRWHFGGVFVNAELITAAIKAGKDAGCGRVLIGADGSLEFRFQVVRVHHVQNFEPKAFVECLRRILDEAHMLPTDKPVFVPSFHFINAWNAMKGDDASAKFVIPRIMQLTNDGTYKGLSRFKTAKQQGFKVRREFFEGLSHL